MSYQKVFRQSLLLSMHFAKKGKQPKLKDFKEFLQEQGVHVLELEGELFIIDQYNEVVARISPHPLGGFEVADMAPKKISR
jgi:hypothetical protein